jgi:outer membrane murein-binding lipoprotein Lpp
MSLGVVFLLLVTESSCKHFVQGTDKRPTRRKIMSNVDLAKQVVHDKLESQIKTAQTKLDALKTQAEAATANLEIKAVATLLPKEQMIQQKLQELKQAGGDKWEQVKTDLEARIAEFERSLKETESQAQAKAQTQPRAKARAKAQRQPRAQAPAKAKAS